MTARTHFVRIVLLIAALFSTCTPIPVMAQDANRKSIPRLEVSDGLRPPVRSSCSQLTNKLSGDVCWNSVDKLLYVWNGTAWISVGTASNGSFSVQGSSVCLEGDTIDDVKTCLTVTDPNQNNTIILSNQSGTVPLLDDSGATNTGGLQLSSGVIASSVETTGGADGTFYRGLAENTGDLLSSVLAGTCAIYASGPLGQGVGRPRWVNATEGVLFMPVSLRTGTDGPPAWATVGTSCDTACQHLLGLTATCGGVVPLDGTNELVHDCSITAGERLCECY